MRGGCGTPKVGWAYEQLARLELRNTSRAGAFVASHVLGSVDAHSSTSTITKVSSSDGACRRRVWVILRNFGW
jgi:hypothetical protein